MSFFNRFFRWVPNPFKAFRQHLHIQQEWQEFKHHMRPHKFKIYFIILATSYPLYAPQARWLKDWASKQISAKFNYFLGVQKPAFQITQNFAKNLLGSIFNDKNVRRQGLEFVNSIIEEQKFVNDILNLLVSALKSSDFMQGLKSLQKTAKELSVQLVENSEFQSAVKKALVNIVSSKEVKDSFIDLIVEAFSSKESIQTTVNLLKKGIESEEVRQSLSGTINYSVQQLLKDQQTINQLKIFIFFLLRKFQNDEQIKSMMDILFAKGLGLTKKKKQNELHKLLQDMDQKKIKSEAEM